MKLYDLFFVGGYVLLPLALCSVMLLAIIMHKTRVLSNFMQQMNLFLSLVMPACLEKDDKRLLALFEKYAGRLTKGHYEIFENMTSNNFKNETLEKKNVWELEQSLKKYLWLIGSLATLAPFIGLFGTVVGIIKSFAAISEAGKSGFSVVSAGLSEALIATAAGILLAIFASFFYNYFNHKISFIKRKYINSLEEFIDVLEGRRR